MPAAVQDEAVQRVAELGLGELEAMLGAVEGVAPVAHAVGPWDQHAPAERLVALAGAEAGQQLLPADGPRAHARADLVDDQSLAPAVQLELRARRRFG